MLYSFSISTPPEPGYLSAIELYAEKVKKEALVAIDSFEMSLDTATAVCVYLDGVDNGDFLMNKELYQKGLAFLLRGFEELPDEQLTILKARNWVAQSLSIIIEEDLKPLSVTNQEEFNTIAAFG